MEQLSEGQICRGGGAISGGNDPEGNFLRDNYPGSNFPWEQLSSGAIVWGGNNPGAVIRGTILLGENCPETCIMHDNF